MEEEIAAANLDIIPSRIESPGLVVLQAGCLKNLLFNANIGRFKEIINDEENGLLFESENYNDLSEKILYLYNNNNLIKEFGKNLNKDVQAKFTLEIMMKKYIKVYQELFDTNNDQYRD